MTCQNNVLRLDTEKPASVQDVLLLHLVVIIIIMLSHIVVVAATLHQTASLEAVYILYTIELESWMLRKRSQSTRMSPLILHHSIDATTPSAGVKFPIWITTRDSKIWRPRDLGLARNTGGLKIVQRSSGTNVRDQLLAIRNRHHAGVRDTVKSWSRTQITLPCFFSFPPFPSLCSIRIKVYVSFLEKRD